MTKIQEALARCKPAIEALARADARCMEQHTERQGMVWERWLLPNGVSVVVVATPHWWNVYSPITSSNMIADTERAIAELARQSVAA